MTPEGNGFDWRRGGVAAGALIATLILLGMVLLVTLANQARDFALAGERHAYDVTLLVRSLDATLSRSEAALGRFVLDEDTSPQGTGAIYADQWRLAGYQLDQLHGLVKRDPEQRIRVTELEALYNERGLELGAAAKAASAKQEQGGVPLYYAASRSATGPELRAKLAEIASAERGVLRASMRQTQIFSGRADRLTDYLSWLGIFGGIMAITLGLLALQTWRENLRARREADTLEEAVALRTVELSEAYQALKAEAEEREAAEAQLRQVQKMEAVGQLTGGIAHDFNNMLAVVVGGLDLARRRLNGPRSEVQLHLTNAMEGATRAAALTRRLLSFARAEPLLPARVEAGDLVGGMSDLLDRTLGERIRVKVDAAADGWPVFVDPHQLENAILNLAVNGRDAMDGVGDLTISTRNVALAAGEVGELDAGDYVRFAVTDTGCGMTPEVIERAFEPFFTTKEVGKGTGLGLSQIFGFAHQSGGEVTIDSVVGVGTTVALLLPRAAGASAEVRMHPAMNQRDSADPSVPGARILLVEDDPRVRAATVGALEDLDYQPVACDSGAEAIRLFESQPFDLVISDVIMPEMTGPELVRELKARRPQTAILFVTGYVGEGESEDLVGYELLRKPFTVSGLAQAVVTALGRNPPQQDHGQAA
ncbi:response regulator [Sphingomonas ginsengisoli (ex An et al. 2013)]|uniref:response regulator n=1 Tax=Sphingomonas ginsengisoli (ex An et al. 2013) TaxID=363835 RepID=UPI000DEF21A2|nr:response regulator [Sphingomonas ginsengisoli An et al. 2013]